MIYGDRCTREFVKMSEDMVSGPSERWLSVNPAAPRDFPYVGLPIPSTLSAANRSTGIVYIQAKWFGH
jgi:hypothetical protein